MAEQRTRVLYVALDAVDPAVMSDLAAQGQAPAIASLLERGVTTETRAPDGVYVSALWPSLFTGRKPSRHRYFCWKQLTPGTYDDELTSIDLIDGVPLWEQLSSGGKSVAVFDVPHSTAPAELDGVFVAEWGCHDRHMGTHSFPASLADEITAQFGRHPVGQDDPPDAHTFAPCDYRHRAESHRTAAETAALIADLDLGLERKQSAAVAIQTQRDWDLCMIVYGEGHCTGHQFWHLHDESHPWHGGSDAHGRGGDPVLDRYRMLDSAVGAHLEAAGEDTVVYLHLTHGMGPKNDGTHLLDQVLDRLAASAPPLASRLASHAIGAALGGRAGATLRPLLRRRRRGSILDLGPDPDPESGARGRATRPFFAIPNNTVSGGIRLNLIGREPNGHIAAGSDADRRVAELFVALEELVNLDTGRPVVAGVVRSSDVFDRTGDDALPDLFVEWHHDSPIERVWSPRIGVVERKYSHWRSGDHHETGLLIAAGPGIDRRDAEGGRPVRVIPVEDVAATLAAATGTLLSEVDGAPVAALLPSSHRRLGGEPTPVSPPPARAYGLRRRVSHLMGREPVDTDVQRSLARLKAPVEHRLGDLERDVHVLQSRANAVQVRTEKIETTIGDHGIRLDEIGPLRSRLEIAERLAQISVVTDWVDSAAPESSATVSVIVPTRNRVDLLSRAVASVQAQRHPNWQLVVVDDASSDGTRDFLSGLEDDRIVSVPCDENVGVAAARNRGLAAADGELIAYLDDDNVLDRLWLRAVAWAFDVHGDADVLYGARVIDDLDRIERRGEGSLPTVHFEPYDRELLLKTNLADMGVIAHRAAHPEAHFDESLDAHADWELFVRLTKTRAPLALPVIATYYFSDGPDRLSVAPADLDLARETVLQGPGK